MHSYFGCIKLLLLLIGKMIMYDYSGEDCFTVFFQASCGGVIGYACDNHPGDWRTAFAHGRML